MVQVLIRETSFGITLLPDNFCETHVSIVALNYYLGFHRFDSRFRFVTMCKNARQLSIIDVSFVRASMQCMSPWFYGRELTIYH